MRCAKIAPLIVIIIMVLLQATTLTAAFAAPPALFWRSRAPNIRPTGMLPKIMVKRMRSLGEVYNDIERLTRLLEENRTASKAITKKLTGLERRPGSAMKENATLKRVLENLHTKEEELQKDIEGLLLFVLRYQINNSSNNSRREFKNGDGDGNNDDDANNNNNDNI